MSSDYMDIKKLINLSEAMLTGKPVEDTNFMNEETRGSDKIDQELSKSDSELMKRKVEKLNLLLKKRYYDADEDIDDTKMYQFVFEDAGDHYKFKMPLSIIFSKKSRQFAARYWNDMFDEADIRVTFEDNIEDALSRAGGIELSMKINKKITKEL